MDSTGRRVGPVPLMGYTDTRWVVEQICRMPGQYSWMIMNDKIALKEVEYFTSEEGLITVVAAAREPRLLASNEMGEPCMATPAISGGMLLIRTRSRLSSSCWCWHSPPFCSSAGCGPVGRAGPTTFSPAFG